MDEFDDRFEPLTESERAAAQAGDDAPKEDGECIIPVPPNQVALAACGGEDEQSFGAMLLADIREVFEARGEKETTSEALVAALIAMRDRPWGECNHGKAITQSLLARPLKPFGVAPKNVGPKHDRAKGYTLQSFADAFKRYIPPDLVVHPFTANELNDIAENQTVRQTNGCTV